MNFQNKIFLLITVVLSISSYAQQQPQFSNYMYNTMSVNPAYAGVNRRGVFNFFARTQWLGMKGGGDTQVLSYNSPVFEVEGLGWGVNILNDKIGPISQLFADVNVSYGVKLTESTRLAFGLKPGLHYFNLDFSKLDPEIVDDSRIVQNNDFYPTIGFGMYLHGDNYYLGVATPNFLESNMTNDENKSSGYKKNHYYFIAGYIFDLKEKLKFKPATMLKAVEGSPISLDVSLNFLIQEKINLGLAWRFGDSMSSLLGFQINEKMHVGYSYDLTTSYFRRRNKGTHELFIRYNLTEIKIPRRLKCFY